MHCYTHVYLTYDFFRISYKPLIHKFWTNDAAVFLDLSVYFDAYYCCVYLDDIRKGLNAYLYTEILKIVT